MKSKQINSDNKALPSSSLTTDQDKDNLALSGDEEQLSHIHDRNHDDLTRTLTQHADHAKTEGAVYRKLLNELKKMANHKP